MDSSQVIGLMITIVMIIGLSIYSGMSNKGKSSGKNGAAVVSGVIIGTLVGGSATVGTAQLAYNYGMSAWWFTLGSGLGCLLLALVFAKPFRDSGMPTLVGMISKEYGQTVGLTASILNSIGTFINIISQLIAATAVIAVIAPGVGIIQALIISALFMVLYVVFGGTRGAGIVGIIKSVLLYVAMIGSGIIVLYACGGFGHFLEMVREIDNPTGVKFFSVLARGAGKDLGSGASLIFGVLTTQTYAQGVLSGKTDRCGRNGALISAFLIPPIGIGGILVGLYMRANYPGIIAKTALTTFVLEHMPSLLGGIVLGALFVAVVGTGAGLALGISSILSNDIIKKHTHRFDNPAMSSMLSKVLIVAVLGLACCMSTGGLGDTILNFAFMSMGLRGAVVFAPLCCALWLPGKIDRKFAMMSVVAGPVAVLIGSLMNLAFDSLFLGIALCIVIMGTGLAVGKR
jgi:SSS family solute:Na+ symporter